MTKTVNYTDAQTTEMVDLYTDVAGESQEVRDAMVLELATELKKSERSIRAKLSREGVYVAKVTKSKVTGEVAAKKIEMANTLIELSGVTKVSAENVAKMNKTDIQAFINVFKALSEDEATDEIKEDESAS
jgi:hypothetical protein